MVSEQPIVVSGRVDRMTASDQDYLVDRVGELQPTVFDAYGRFAHGKKPTIDISDLGSGRIRTHAGIGV